MFQHCSCAPSAKTVEADDQRSVEVEETSQGAWSLAMHTSTVKRPRRALLPVGRAMLAVRGDETAAVMSARLLVLPLATAAPPLAFLMRQATLVYVL